MHWYNPKEGKVEDVRAPSTDEEACSSLARTFSTKYSRASFFSSLGLCPV